MTYQSDHNAGSNVLTSDYSISYSPRVDEDALVVSLSGKFETRCVRRLGIDSWFGWAF